MDFSRIIEKYSTDFTIIEFSEGNYEDGEYVKGNEIRNPKKGAIFPMSQRKIYNSGGNYKTQDKQLYTTQYISLETEKFILHNKRKYKIEEDTDYSDFADIYIYILKRVDSFDRTEKN